MIPTVPDPVPSLSAGEESQDFKDGQLDGFQRGLAARDRQIAEGVLPKGVIHPAERELAECKEALKPFAALFKIAQEYGHTSPSTCEWRISFDDLERAARALDRGVS